LSSTESSQPPSGIRFIGCATGFQPLKSPTRLTCWACGAWQMKLTARAGRFGIVRLNPPKEAEFMFVRAASRR
jgi:hypothetical protein